MSYKAIIALAFVALVSACAVAPEGSRPQQVSGVIDQSAPPIIINGSGGGTVGWGRESVNQVIIRAYREGRPVRLSGRFVSAGTFFLYAVENISGSCVEADAIFAFHRAVLVVSVFTTVPIPITGERSLIVNANAAEAYNPALSRWFLDGIEEGRITGWFTNRTGAQLGAFGYNTCEEEQ